MTKHNAANVDIHAKTGILTSRLSKIRNGQSTNIYAQELFLITLAIEKSIGDIVVKVYPDLRIEENLSETLKPLTKLGRLIDSFKVMSPSELAQTTGISLPRLTGLAKKSADKILSHELYLIEMACGQKPGTFFKELFNDLQLNSLEKQNELRVKEIEKNYK